MRKSIPVNENKVALDMKAPKLKDKYEKHIVLTVCDPDNSIEKLLNYVKELANTGHSFDIHVDPDIEENHRSFGIDGDGLDHIYDIEVEKYEE